MASDQFLPSKAKILIVDDHPMVREGLAMHIATQGDMEVCGEAEDVTSALKTIEAVHPDLVIVDISLKNSNGIDLIHRIRDLYDHVHVLIWSMYHEKHYAERALRAGARGYLNKTRATRSSWKPFVLCWLAKCTSAANSRKAYSSKLPRATLGSRPFASFLTAN